MTLSFKSINQALLYNAHLVDLTFLSDCTFMLIRLFISVVLVWLLVAKMLTKFSFSFSFS